MILALWMACRGVIHCDETEPCPFGGTCDDGICAFRHCTTSGQCPLEHTCDIEGACRPGCAVDDDCYAGDICDGGTCRPRACTDTHVDCAFRETCEQGRCVDAGEPFCAACTTDDECGAGNLCWEGGYCGVDCSGGGACPAAFECLAVDQDGTSREVCLAACWLEE